jgi:sterol desaturase/sphingolipid hydroxylase (fatty acid hydroxylase superfamily)
LKQPFRRIASLTVMPLTLVAVLGGAALAMRVGVPPMALIAPFFVLSILWVAALERWLPYRPEWNQPRGDLRADAAYLLSTSAVIGVMRGAVATVGALIASWISRRWGLPLWPQDSPLYAQLPLAWALVELFAYWPHRWLHSVPWLWRLHATHHSAERLYWLNATRAHPLEHVFRSSFGLLPLAVVGAGPELLALSVLSDAVIGLFQHANIDLKLGPLNYVFSAAPVHRWHHSRVRAEADTNFGDSFIFWDLVFGTYYHPKDREVAEIGIGGLEAFPRDVLAQLASPFRWREIERSSMLSS